MSRNHALRRSYLDELLDGQPAYKKQKIASASTLILNGERAYSEKRYKDAIKYFTQAIDSSHDKGSDKVHLYEIRSNAYVRDRQLELAEKDAKCMIRLDQSDARGYLQYAQVSQVTKNFGSVIKVCERGMKSVTKSSSGYAKLETSMIRAGQIMKQKVIYEKGTDPFEVLPNELIDLVLDPFDYRQVVGLLRVSKRWWARLKSRDLLTQTIDTRKTERRLTYPEVAAAIARLDKRPKKLALTKLNEGAARKISQMLKDKLKWESLEELIVDDGKVSLGEVQWKRLRSIQVLELGQTASSSSAKLEEVVRESPSLRRVLLSGSPWMVPPTCLLNVPATSGQNLRELRLCFGVEAHPNTHQIQFPNHCVFPNLERLDLGNVGINSRLDLTSYIKLRQLSLLSAPINERYNLRTPPSLQEFALVGRFPSIYPEPEEIKMPTSNIHTVSVKGRDSIRFLAYALRQGLEKDMLRRLSISDFIVFSQIAGRHINSDLVTLSQMPRAEVFESIQYLALRDDNIDDGMHHIIVKLFPGVEYIDLESAKITESFLSDLIKGYGATLRSLNIPACSATSGDIVEWARARGVKINLGRRSWHDNALGERQIPGA